MKLGSLGVSVLVMKNHLKNYSDKFKIPQRISPFQIQAEEVESPNIKHKNKDSILGM